MDDESLASQSPVYLDYNATTPVAPEVTEVMLNCLREEFGNPSSSYVKGQEALTILTRARDSVAGLIAAESSEITFTGCATEANNLAILGVCKALKANKKHLVISSIEHPAVLEPARYLQSLGWQLTEVAVDEFGMVSPKNLTEAMRPDTALVSIMHANNEVGTIQAIAELAQLVKSNGSIVHTDAAQSVGKLEVDVNKMGVDLLTIAGHKFYASKGVGALYVRAGTPIEPILYGANQEEGLRPGTENVALIAGMGVAADLAHVRLPTSTAKLQRMRDSLQHELYQGVTGLQLNGHPSQRLPNTLHVSFPNVSGRELLSLANADVMASVGSACHSEQDQVSGVLAAMGLSSNRARGAVRLSTGLSTTQLEIERAAGALIDAWRQLTASSS